MLRDARSSAESPAQFGSPNVRLITRTTKDRCLERDYRASKAIHEITKSFVRALSCDFVDRSGTREIRHETNPGHRQINSLTTHCVLCYYPRRQREVSAGFVTGYPMIEPTSFKREIDAAR